MTSPSGWRAHASSGSLRGSWRIPRTAFASPLDAGDALLALRARLAALPDGPARLTRQTLGRIRVQTLSPVVLTKDQLQLGKAFEVLQAVCGHKALSGAVPIQFDLVFQDED